ncbi:MAG: hypothetical protein ACI4SH_01970 [Candidatus Scatosoma sp.]
MKRTHRFVAVPLCVCMFFSAVTLSACSKNDDADFTEKIAALPETPDNGTPSWEQGDKSPVTIDWFINASTLNPTFGTDSVTQTIREKTGVTINFRVAVSDDDQELTKMFTSGMPDVVTVEASSDLINSMATQGYAYPIESLAKRVAPGMFEGGYNGYFYKEQDIQNWYKIGEDSYGMPNFQYSSYYYDKNTRTEPNGAILVREDWYNEAASKGIDMTTPDGFMQACAYVKSKYPNAIPVQFDRFTADGCKSLQWLSQYFAVPFETENGEYIYNYEHENYKEMMSFVNGLYNKKYLDSSNLSANYTMLAKNIANKNVFCTVGTPQDYRDAYISCYKSGVTYIPLVLRNSAKDDPVLQDLRGFGWLFNMISKDCKHADRVMKLFDYLSSDEGQLLVRYGVQGESWEWADEEKTHVKYTEEYIEDYKKKNTSAASGKEYGLGLFLMIFSYGYSERVKPTGADATAVMKDYDVYFYNLKKPLTPYSYSYMPVMLKIDKTQEGYRDYLQKYNRVTRQYAKYVTELISCNANQFDQKYKEIHGYLDSYGLQDVIARHKSAYEITKQSLGINGNGYPKYTEGYVSPSTGANGDFSFREYVTKE